MAAKDMTYKGFAGSINVSLEDKCLHGRLLFIDDIITYEAESVEEIVKEFQLAVDQYIDHCASTGKPANKPYSGTFNVRVGPELHREVARLAREQQIGLNDFVVKALHDAVDQNGVHKIEHVHSHNVNVTIRPYKTVTKLASMDNQLGWESYNETAH